MMNHDVTPEPPLVDPVNPTKGKHPKGATFFGEEAGTIEEFLAILPKTERQSAVTSASTQERSHNVLRPASFDDIVGQARVKAILRRMLQSAKSRNEPMDHVLLVGPSGTGKTTFAHCIAAELGSTVYQIEAPISHDTLLELRETMNDGDILFIDEIHQQAIAERRGKSSATQPEVLFAVMEDRTLPTQSGVLDFPHITIIGGTTDEGALPDAFVNRFPVRPRMEKYSVEEMAEIVQRNAVQLGLAMGPNAALKFARASRGVPREANNFVRNAASLTTGRVGESLVNEVLFDLNGVTEDGLTSDMQRMLVFLYTRAKRTNKGTGEVVFQASVSTIATAIGKSRDQKAIALRVEPYLIEKGYVQVGHGGRTLTDAGIDRACQLLEEGVTV